MAGYNLHTYYNVDLFFFKVDDPIDAMGIHIGGGLAGMLSAPFLLPNGILIAQDMHSAVVHQY